MLDYARLTPGPGFQPRAALYYVQRLVPLPGPRRWVARGIAAAINASHGSRRQTAAAKPAGPWGETLGTIRRDGHARLDGLVTPAAVRDIMAYLAGHQVVASDGRSWSLDRVPPGTPMASYPLECLLRCPTILALINHPAVLECAARYLGCTPTISSLGVRWSFPAAAGVADTQLFHRDPDDWRFLKLFVYLTDVDADSGPHMFVTGSHKTAGRLRARPYSLKEIEATYGPTSVATITGPAGTCFLADTYGIHRGAVPVSRPRLMLQVQYSLLPIFAFQYQPMAMEPRPQVDAYVNRLLLRPS